MVWKICSMPDYRGWEIIKSLGEGGQGEVFLVRSPQRVSERREANTVVKTTVVRLNGIGRDAHDHDLAAQRLADAVLTYSRPETRNELGALKQYKMPEGEEGKKVDARFINEVQALWNLKEDPAVLQVVEYDPHEHWILTSYYERGSLSRHQSLFEGNVSAALMALRPVVEVLAKLHEKGIVHRDIKPRNIFLNSANKAVLGDFGIVFLEAGNRPTELLERVGSRDWMAPWAHTGMRIDDVQPSFDVFPMGKVIWSVISGRPVLPYWYHRHSEYDLTKQFPDDPAMHAVNDLLDRCVVELEKDCVTSAGALLKIVDETLVLLRAGGQPVSDAIPRRCRVCGRGHYLRLKKDSISVSGAEPILVDLYGCEFCGHIQMFGRRATKFTGHDASDSPRFWDVPL